jgi:predicted amidophosphoribosyltransferase
MECPHCHQALPFLLCSGCGSQTPEESLFCFKCGKPVRKEESAEKGMDPSERILCSDGNCIGVMNERGVCNVCGKPSADPPA